VVPFEIAGRPLASAIASVVATACKLAGAMHRIRQDEIDWPVTTTLMGLIAILGLCGLAVVFFL
jgi:uncharacterized membrane protein YfcA